MSVDDEWNMFMNNDTDDINSVKLVTSSIIDKSPPICDELYISTKTKVLFLNQPIDIGNIFWKLPIIDYGNPVNGIVKKQMKIVSNSEEEYNDYTEKIKDIKYYTENIIKQINNPTARRIKYKDERKITVGLSKKDIMNCRGKVKNAFYNCFALIVRFKYENIFKEIHIKVFNTGKLEIPGILNVELLEIVKKMLLELLHPFITKQINYIKTDVEENVLINSNFNCGYYINRDKLYAILRSEKYGIETAFDPCSYPGVKSKFYFNNELGVDSSKHTGKLVKEDRTMKMSELGDTKKYTEVSFMIFRTGSCLIVGNCTEKILYFVFDFVKKLLHDEFHNLYVETEKVEVKEKKMKIRKKDIIVSNEYYEKYINV
tara:strand:- start:5548 stop:6666 length:1119 start_codon:yes stop_codon:yes gene_type:complete